MKNYDQEANCELVDNGNKVDTANDGEEWYGSDNACNEEVIDNDVNGYESKQERLSSWFIHGSEIH